MRLTIKEVVAATNGKIIANPSSSEAPSAKTDITPDIWTDHGADTPFVDGVSIDSRTIQAGQLFIPLLADRDGHEYIGDAVHSGAGAVLVSRSLDTIPSLYSSNLTQPGSSISTPIISTPIIHVSNTTKALHQLGIAARNKLEKNPATPTRIIAITGSAGKTTTKDLCATALNKNFKVSASQKSHNNELGVPLTLLNAPEGVEVVVVEMGASKPGDIASLCDVARPDIGVLTAVGIAHTEGFDNLESIAKTKAELLESLPAGGTAVLNRDNPQVMDQAKRVFPSLGGPEPVKSKASNSDWSNSSRHTKILTFGTHPEADIRAENITADNLLRCSFELYSEFGNTQIHLQLTGRHNVSNALAAVAAYIAASDTLESISMQDIAAGLSEAVPVEWRMSQELSRSGVLVLNDAYNANPLSMKAALLTLTELPGKRKVAVLGTMSELGVRHKKEHQLVAALAKELGVEVIAWQEEAYKLPLAQSFAEIFSAVDGLKEGDVVLVKGSRSVGMETLATKLLDL